MDLRLKEILAQKGITLKEFSQISGISQSNLSNYINGNISPTLDTLKKIASYLGVDLIEMFKEKEDVEFFVRYKGELHPISKNDIINLITPRR